MRVDGRFVVAFIYGKETNLRFVRINGYAPGVAVSDEVLQYPLVSGDEKPVLSVGGGGSSFRVLS